jgi:PhnB protein
MLAAAVREAGMAEAPEYSPVSVYLTVTDGFAAVEFYKAAFAAEVRDTYPWEGRLGHATLRINGADVMLADEFDEAVTGMRSPKALGGTSCTVSLAVSDADEWFDRATAAGCAVVRPLNDEFYGRMGKVRDPYGHCWGFVGPAKGPPAPAP